MAVGAGFKDANGNTSNGGGVYGVGADIYDGFNSVFDQFGFAPSPGATAQKQNYGGVPGGATAEATRASDIAAQRAAMFQGQGANASSQLQGQGAATAGQMYGQGAAANGALQGQGQAARNDLNSAGNQFRQEGNAAAQNANYAGYGAQGDSKAYQTAAMGDYGTQLHDRQQSVDALSQLQGFLGKGPGPSAAQAQLAQQSDANMGSAMALARSGRGAGDNAAAMRNAQFQNAATQQQTNQAAAGLRAQEAANWNQTQMAGMGLQQNTLGAMRGQDLSSMGQNQQSGIGYGQLGAQYTGLGNQAQNAGAQLGASMYGQGASIQSGYNQAGAQTGLGYNQLGANTQLGYNNAATQAGLGYGQLAGNQYTSGESGRNDILKAQLGSDTSVSNAQTQADMQTQTASDQKHKDNIGFVGSILGGVLSDEREKTNIQSYGLDEDLDPWGRDGSGASKQREQDQASAKKGGGGLLGGIMGGMSNYGGGGGGMLSDVRNKKNIEPSSMAQVFGQPAAAPHYDFRPAQGYSYDYKDPSAPGADGGRQFGPMAQDLEKTPAGAAAVKTGPDGKKMVDAGRLTMANTAAISEQQRTIDRLKALLDQGYGQQARDTGPRFAMGGNGY